DLGNLFLSISNKNEQQKISNFLDYKTSQFDSIIEKKEKLIEKLEEAKKSLISEVVTGKAKIVDGKLVKRDESEMKDSGDEWLGKISKDWEIAKLLYLSKNITDGAHISPDTNNGKKYFVSVRDLKDNKIDFENSLLTTKQNYKYLAKMGCKPIKGDVLISKDGTLGETVVVDYNKDFVVASSLVIIKPLINVDPFYLEYILNTNYYQEQIKMFARGAALPRISISNIKKSKIIYTNDQLEQENIVKFLDKHIKKLFSTIIKTKHQINKIKQAKQSLISEAVTGKIDLRDWEIKEIKN
ncbi:MAG: restriction endonuclease subunit S, partial [Bacillota bacterium]|nr:restriction endonuclease subunit S [Bacillota bacterium]